MMEKLSEEALIGLELDRRIDIAYDWAQSLAQVVQQSNHSAGLELLEFFDGRAGIGIPMPDEDRQIDFGYFGDPGEKDPYDFVYLTPLLVGDASRLPPDDTRQQYISGNSEAVASYSSEWRAIYLPTAGEQGSRTMKGLVLLHELLHAHHDFAGNFTAEDEAEQQIQHWLEEVAVYEVELDVFGLLAGKTYRRVVDHFVRRFVKEYEQNSEVSFEIWFERRTFKKIALTAGLNDTDFDINLFIPMALLDVVRRTMKKAVPEEWQDHFAYYLSQHPFADSFIEEGTDT